MTFPRGRSDFPDVDGTFPLSTIQREVWLDQTLNPSSLHFNVAGYARIHGPIDMVIFERAVEYAITRHDALRIVLVEREEIPVQRILPHVPPALAFIDLSNYPDAEERASAWIRTAVAVPFSLYEKPLFQFALLRVATDKYIWFTCYHHLICDGLALMIVVQSAADAYNALIRSQSLPTSPAASYVDFVIDDKNYNDSELFEQDRVYWKNIYDTLPEPLFIPRVDCTFEDRPRSDQVEPAAAA